MGRQLHALVALTPGNIIGNCTGNWVVIGWVRETSPSPQFEIRTAVSIVYTDYTNQVIVVNERISGETVHIGIKRQNSLEGTAELVM